MKKEPDDAILIISFSVMSVQEDIMLFVLGVICVLDVIGFLVVVGITVYVPLIVILLVFLSFFMVVLFKQSELYTIIVPQLLKF